MIVDVVSRVPFLFSYCDRTWNCERSSEFLGTDCLPKTFPQQRAVMIVQPSVCEWLSKICQTTVSFDGYDDVNVDSGWAQGLTREIDSQVSHADAWTDLVYGFFRFTKIIIVMVCWWWTQSRSYSIKAELPSSKKADLRLIMRLGSDSSGTAGSGHERSKQMGNERFFRSVPPPRS